MLPELISPRPRSASIFALIALAGSLAACFGSRAPAPAPAVISFTELTRAVVEMRGLALKRDLKVETVQINGDAADNPDNSADLARAYQRIGLLPGNVEYSTALVEYRRLERSVYYDSATATVLIRPEASNLGHALSENDPRAAVEMPGVLGIALALQEQHFQWQQRLKSVMIEDRRLAFRALATGDATLVALARAHGKVDLSSLAAARSLARLASAVEKSAAHLPELLRRKLVFPYREGSRFVSWAQANRNWAGVNGLYADPPLSTAQILHPEKYYVRRESALRMDAWGLGRQMKEPPRLEQTLGEELVGLLLTSAVSVRDAERIAGAWQADLLRSYNENNDVATVWISAWQGEKEAAEFFRAYLAVLEKARGVRLQPAAARNDAHAEFPGGRALVVQVKGSAVLLLDGLSLARGREVAEDLWRDLEVQKEATEIPFESAGNVSQRASSRR